MFLRHPISRFLAISAWPGRRSTFADLHCASPLPLQLALPLQGWAEALPPAPCYPTASPMGGRPAAVRSPCPNTHLLPVWNVDCEYDRYGQLRKGLEGTGECSGMRAPKFILWMPSSIIAGPMDRTTFLLFIETKHFHDAIVQRNWPEQKSGSEGARATSTPERENVGVPSRSR